MHTMTLCGRGLAANVPHRARARIRPATGAVVFDELVAGERGQDALRNQRLMLTRATLSAVIRTDANTGAVSLRAAEFAWLRLAAERGGKT